MIFSEQFCIINFLYLDDKPFALCHNFGMKGFVVQLVDSNGHLSGYIAYKSYLDFERSFPKPDRRFKLGPPFPVNPSDSDVK